MFPALAFPNRASDRPWTKADDKAWWVAKNAELKAQRSSGEVFKRFQFQAANGGPLKDASSEAQGER